MSSKKWYAAVVTIVVLLTIVSIVYAAHTTINTNDGAVDSNWVNVSVHSNDGDDIADNNHDINQAWVANAADNSAFYFRANLVGAGRLPQNGSSVEARLDCDRNGSFGDAVDVVVYYAPVSYVTGLEEPVECQGNDYPDCDYATEPNHSDTNAATFAEEIAASPYTYEWRADVTNGSANWSACLGQINVQFASLDLNLATLDVTAWRGYNVPTAVELAGLAAKPGRDVTGSVWAVIALLGVFVGGGLIWRGVRRSTSHPGGRR